MGEDPKSNIIAIQKNEVLVSEQKEKQSEENLTPKMEDAQAKEDLTSEIVEDPKTEVASELKEAHVKEPLQNEKAGSSINKATSELNDAKAKEDLDLPNGSINSQSQKIFPATDGRQTNDDEVLANQNVLTTPSSTKTSTLRSSGGKSFSTPTGGLSFLDNFMIEQRNKKTMENDMKTKNTKMLNSYRKIVVDDDFSDTSGEGASDRKITNHDSFLRKQKKITMRMKRRESRARALMAAGSKFTYNPKTESEKENMKRYEDLTGKTFDINDMPLHRLDDEVLLEIFGDQEGDPIITNDMIQKLLAIFSGMSEDEYLSGQTIFRSSFPGIPWDKKEKTEVEEGIKVEGNEINDDKYEKPMYNELNRDDGEGSKGHIRMADKEESSGTAPQYSSDLEAMMEDNPGSAEGVETNDESTKKRSMKKWTILFLLFGLGAGLAVGFFLGNSNDSSEGNQEDTETQEDTQTPIPNETQLMERQVLADFYAAANGVNWTDNSKWLSDDSPCFWFGLKCDDMGMVERIDLADNNLSGQALIPELGLLSEVRNIMLQKNSISGSIPTEIGILTKIKKLHLFSNPITGSIPSEIGMLGSMTSLILDYMELTGTLPSELGRASELIRLDFAYNNLHSSIPSNLGDLANLSTIYGQSNDITGSVPEEVCALELDQFVLDCFEKISCAEGCCNICL